MKTRQISAYGLIAVILALTLTACPEPEPEPEPHTHTYATTWSTDATQHWRECTAGDGAKTDVANHTGNPCTVCGYDSATPTHTHQWGAWTETTPATCTTEGEETRTCTLDATHQETQPIAALGHDWGNWEVTTPATTTTEGEETRTCKNDATHKETQPIAKLNPTCPCPPKTVHPFGTTCPSNCEAKGTPYCTCSIDVQREFKIGNVAIRDSRAANPSDQTLEQLGVIGKFETLLTHAGIIDDPGYINIAPRGLMIVLEDGVEYANYRAIDGNTIGANLTWVLATANIVGTSNRIAFTGTLDSMDQLNWIQRTIARARVQGKIDLAAAGGAEPPMKKGKYNADYRKLVAGVTGTNLPSVVMRHGTLQVASLQGVCRKICFYRSYIGLLKTASLF